MKKKESNQQDNPVAGGRKVLTPKERAEEFKKKETNRVERNIQLVTSPTYSAVSTQTGEAIDLSYLVTSFDLGMKRLRGSICRNPRMTPQEGIDLIEKGQAIVQSLNAFNVELYRKVGMNYNMPIRMRKQKTPAQDKPAQEPVKTTQAEPTAVKPPSTAVTPDPTEVGAAT